MKAVEHVFKNDSEYDRAANNYGALGWVRAYSIHDPVSGRVKAVFVKPGSGDQNRLEYVDTSNLKKG